MWIVIFRSCLDAGGKQSGRREPGTAAVVGNMRDQSKYAAATPRRSSGNWSWSFRQQQQQQHRRILPNALRPLQCHHPLVEHLARPGRWSAQFQFRAGVPRFGCLDGHHCQHKWDRAIPRPGPVRCAAGRVAQGAGGHRPGAECRAGHRTVALTDDMCSIPYLRICWLLFFFYPAILTKLFHLNC